MSEKRTKSPSTTHISRRKLLAGAGIAIAAPAILRPNQARANKKIVYVSFGGTTQTAQERIFIQPFMKDTGIEVITASGPDIAKVKAMVQARNVEWDLVNFTGSQASTLAREGLLENLDLDILQISPQAHANPAWLKETTIGWYYYTGGIGYDAKRHPAGKHPRDWVQFWDAKAFPGRRGLRTRAEETLEMALMADGVAAKDLYPLDVDRAFKSLDRIKPHVSNWIKATPETITLVQRNEVDFVFTYSGRIEAAKAQGLPLEFVYETPLSSPSFLAIPKGSSNKDAAMKLASYFLRNDLQKAWALDQPGYSPVRRQSIEELPAEVKARLPDPDNPRGAFIDVDWWATNYVETEKRLKEWLIL